MSKEVTAQQLIETVSASPGASTHQRGPDDAPQGGRARLQQFQELSSRSEAEAFISPLTPREIEILQ
jgi:hypothetical protein